MNTEICTAGSGKTRRAHERIVHWVGEGVPPHTIAYQTFQRRDIAALVKRLPPGLQLPWVNTVHALALRFAGYGGKRIYLVDKNPKWFRKFGAAHGLNGLVNFSEGEPENELDAALKIWAYARSRQAIDPPLELAYEISPDFYKEFVGKEDFLQFINFYEGFKTETKHLDFLDSMRDAIVSERESHLTHVITDEFQDLPPRMMFFVERKLEAGAKVVYRLGDPNQSICSYTGVDYSLTLEAMHRGEVTLCNVSHRVPSVILAHAESLVAPGFRYGVEGLRSASSHEGVLKNDASRSLPDLAHISTEETVGVLFRNRRHLNRVSKEMAKGGTVFVGGHSPLSAEMCHQLDALHRGLLGEEITNVEWLAALTFVKEHLSNSLNGYAKNNAEKCAHRNPYRKTTLLGIKPEVKRELKRDLLWIITAGKAPTFEKEQTDYLHNLVKKHGPEVFGKEPNITLSTIHNSKGGEWDHVFAYQESVSGCADGRASNPDEEKRLKFVAATRAKKTFTSFGGGEETSYSYRVPV